MRKFQPGPTHDQGCTATEDGERLKILDLVSTCKGIVLSNLAKTKALSCTVTVQLICAFVFAYAKSRFSHGAAHIYICEVTA